MRVRPAVQGAYSPDRDATIYSAVLIRIRAAIQSPDAARRLRDFIVGRVLQTTPVGVRRYLFRGESHFCPVCGNTVSRFLVMYRDYHLWCPVCWSLQRHRLVWHFLNLPEIDIARKPRRMLHVAPEPGFAQRLRAMRHVDYLSADLFQRNAMVRMDICDIQYPADSFDLIYCSHVLEHVPDDKQALREFRRVLRANGEVILLVPQRPGPTDEDPTLTDPAQRERRFGQLDHVRIYGDDFAQRVCDAGFTVREFRTADLLTVAEMRRIGASDDRIYYCQPA